MKKPKLSKYIITAGVIAIFLFVITYSVTIGIVDMMDSNQNEMAYSGFQDAKERTAGEQLMSADPEVIRKEGLKSEEYGIGLAEVDFIMKIYSTIGQVSTLYDREGNVVSDSSKAVFFKVYKKNDKGEKEHIRLETEYNDEWKELFDEAGDKIYDEKIGENDAGLPKDVTFNEFFEGNEYPEALDMTMGSQIVADEIYVKGGIRESGEFDKEFLHHFYWDEGQLMPTEILRDRNMFSYLFGMAVYYMHIIRLMMKRQLIQ